MDFIKLERLEPISQRQIARPSLSKPPRPVPRPPVSNPRPLVMNTGPYNAQFQRGKFSHLRHKLYAALPIPPQVIPILSSQLQVLEYEQLLLQPDHIVDNMTIGQVLEPFSVNRGHIEKDKFGKILFIKKLVTKLTNNDVNYDMAIICHSRASEKYVFESLATFKFNLREISDLPGSDNLFGVIVKIRKNAKTPQQYTPIERREVDVLVIYDSACHTQIIKEYDIFKGVRYEKPTLFYLCSMDTAEIRIHTYNRFVSNDKKAIGWDTKISEIDRDLKQIVLFQPNREPDNTFFGGWNDYLSQAVFNWASVKENDFFEFKFPSKGGLFTHVCKFIVHHPTHATVTKLPAPKNNSIVIPNSTKRVDINPIAKQQLSNMTATNAMANLKNPANRGDRSRSNSGTRPDSLPIPPVIHPERMALLQDVLPMKIDETRKRSLNSDLPPSNKFRRTAIQSIPLPIATQPITPIPTPVESMSPLVQPVSPQTRLLSPATPESEKHTETALPPSEQVQAVAAEITHEFDDFLAKALKQFEDEISSIKF